MREFPALLWWRRLLYRLYRHPIVMFGGRPAYLFIFQHRLAMDSCAAACRSEAFADTDGPRIHHWSPTRKFPMA